MSERNRVMEQNVVDYIVWHTAHHGYPPSIRAIANYVDRTQSHIHSVIQRLVREGIIEVTPGIARSVRVKGANMKASDEFI